MQTVWDHVRLAAARTPDRTAMVDDRGPRRASFSELVGEAEAMAAGLAAAGLCPGERAAVMLPNIWEHAVAILALHRLGAVPCLINPRLKPDEARALMQAGEARLAICMADEAVAAAASEAVGGDDRVLCVGGAVSGTADLASIGGDAADLAPWSSPDAEALSLVLYTSGTTGLPKGVMLAHRVTDARILYVSTQCGLRHGGHNRAIGLMPLFHAVGLYSAFLCTLTMNGTYYVHSAFDPAAAVDCIERDRITFLYGAPAHFHALLAAPGFSEEKMRSVETLVYAGAVMPGPLLDRVRVAFPRARMTNIYGTTEVMNALYMPDPAGCPTKYRPGFYSDVRVGRIGGGVDELCGIGEEGEVLVDAAADATFSGYLGRPDATTEKLADGWYRTGDIAVRLEDGDLELRGRVDDMIVSGGENIHPEEIETILRQCGGVRDAAVIGVADERLTERVVACVVADGTDPEALDAWCLASPLADYKRPRGYVFVDELPRNAANKVLRRELRAMAEAEAAG